MYKVKVEFCEDEDDLFLIRSWGNDRPGGNQDQDGRKCKSLSSGMEGDLMSITSSPSVLGGVVLTPTRKSMLKKCAKKLPWNEFWVTEETTFDQLCVDAVRYFVHEDSIKVTGRLFNGRLCEWKGNGNVLAHLSACPSEHLRRIILRTRDAELWEQNDRLEETKAREADLLDDIVDFETETVEDTEVSTLNDLSKSKNDKKRRSSTDSKSIEAFDLEEVVHRRLLGMYSTYCLQGHHSNDNGITLQEFQHFVSDLRLDLPRERVALIHISVRSKTYDGFLNMLVLLARMKFPKAESDLDALEEFVRKHVAPFSATWESAEFDGFPGEPFLRRLENKKHVRALLQKNLQPMLKHAFNAYCLNDPSIPFKSKSKYLTLAQFQLFVQDFELYGSGAYLDARIVARIFLSLCDFSNHHANEGGEHDNELTDDRMKSPNSRMFFAQFAQAFYRLAVILAIPYMALKEDDKREKQQSEEERVRERKEKAWTVYQCVSRALVRNPTIVLKAICQHIHFTVFGRDYKLKALCGKLESRRWRKGSITPLGSQNDIVACSGALAREFLKLWQKDGCPDDYYAIIVSKVRDMEASLVYEKSVMLNGDDQVASMFFKSVKTDEEEERQEYNVKHKDKNNEEDKEDEEEEQQLYPQVISQSADDSFKEASTLFRKLVEDLVDHLQGYMSTGMGKKKVNLDAVVKIFENANLRYTSLVRGCKDPMDQNQVQWRWGVSLVGLVSRMVTSCLSIFQTKSGSVSSCWLTGSWDSMCKGEESIRSCSDLFRLCEFARACLEQADGKFHSVERFLQSESHELGNEGEYKLALDRASTYRMMAQVKVIMVRLRLFRLSSYRVHDTRELVQFFRNMAKGALEADHYFGRAAVYYEKVRFSNFFRTPLLNNWAFVLFEQALSKAAASVALERSSFYEDNGSMVIGSPLSDPYGDESQFVSTSSETPPTTKTTVARQEAEEEEQKGFNEEHRPTLHVETKNLSKDSPVVPLCVLKKIKMEPKIQMVLQRAREIAGLGFELENEHESCCEWFVPVALLWSWGNCVNITEVFAFFTRKILAKATMTNSSNSSNNNNEKETMKSTRQHVLEGQDIFQFSSEDSRQMITEPLLHAIHQIFRHFDAQKKGAIPKIVVDDMLRQLLIWDASGLYTQLVVSQMRERGFARMKLAHFTSFMLFLLFSDPLGLAKLLYVSDSLEHFGFHDKGHGSNKNPSNLFITSLLYQSFEESGPKSRLRRLHRLQRVRSPSVVLFRPNGEYDADVDLFLDGGSNDKIVAVETDQVSPENRLVDYFVVLDAHAFDSNLTASQIGQFTSVGDIPLKPRVRNVWPPKPEHLLASRDAFGYSVEEIASIRLLYEMVPLPDDLPTFCFTEDSYHASERILETKRLNRLVLTDSSGVKRFGLILTFYEEVSFSFMIKRHEQRPYFTEKLLQTCRNGKRWYAPTCICVLSRWPLFTTFERCLTTLLRISKSEAPFPLERYISTFVNDTPVPPKGGMQVQTILGDTPIYIQRPAKNELPLVDFSFVPLFSSLNRKNILTVFSCLLQEVKVVLCSANKSILTPVAEAFRALLFPFELQCIYIPVLPGTLTDFLYAPVPFFYGVDVNVLDIGTVPVASSPSFMRGYDDDEFPPELDGATATGPVDDDNHSINLLSPSILSPRQHLRNKFTGRSRAHQQPPSVYSIAVEPNDVVYVDLDHDRILLPLQSNQKPLSITALPKQLQRKLLDGLKRAMETIPSSPDPHMETYLDRVDEKPSFNRFVNLDSRIGHVNSSSLSSMSRIPKHQHIIDHSQWTLNLRNTFSEFSIRLLRNYRKYIVKSKTDADWTFDKQAFLADHASSREFCSVMFNTQLFDCFVRDAILTLNGNSNSRTEEIQLFDELIVDKDNKAKTGRLYTRQKKQKQPTPLLDSKDGTIRETVYTPCPGQGEDKRSKGPHQTYTYRTFPTLDPQLMKSDKPKRKLTYVPKTTVVFMASELKNVK